MRSMAGASKRLQATSDFQVHIVKGTKSSSILRRLGAIDQNAASSLQRAIPRTMEREYFQPVNAKDNLGRNDTSPRGTGSRQAGWQGGPRTDKSVNRATVNKRLVTAPDNEQLPRLEALVIVEGFNDCVAIHRAVRSPVFILGGGYALAEEMKPELCYVAELAAAGQLPRQVVVFTDPDWQGRMFRTYLDDLLLHAAPSPNHQFLGSNPKPRKGLVVRHAFLRVEEGTSDVASRYHEVGNVGVEHASPETIRACLVRARPGFGPGRTEFKVEQLRADGLIGSWDDKNQVAGPQLRRGHFCRALGIDAVGTGKGLVNLLNRYFTREEYEAALKVAKGNDPQSDM